MNSLKIIFRKVFSQDYEILYNIKHLMINLHLMISPVQKQIKTQAEITIFLNNKIVKFLKSNINR